MDSLLRDLKCSARSLLQRPALTIIAIVTLAIGIGANRRVLVLRSDMTVPIARLVATGGGDGGSSA